MRKKFACTLLEHRLVQTNSNGVTLTIFRFASFAQDVQKPNELRSFQLVAISYRILTFKRPNFQILKIWIGNKDPSIENARQPATKFPFQNGRPWPGLEAKKTLSACLHQVVLRNTIKTRDRIEFANRINNTIHLSKIHASVHKQRTRTRSAVRKKHADSPQGRAFRASRFASTHNEITAIQECFRWTFRKFRYHL